MNKGLKTLLFPLILCASCMTFADDDLDAITADCRMEGEAAGMSGQALEDFTRECVEDLSGVTFDNQVGPEEKK